MQAIKVAAVGVCGIGTVGITADRQPVAFHPGKDDELRVGGDGQHDGDQDRAYRDCQLTALPAISRPSRRQGAEKKDAARGQTDPVQGTEGLTDDQAGQVGIAELLEGCGSEDKGEEAEASHP